MEDGEKRAEELGSEIDENIGAILHEAEERFRQGARVLNDLGQQAREIIRRQPAAVLAGVAALGFVSGLLLRRAVKEENRQWKTRV
ncbi:MAG: hypothetical protein HY074_09165 [Deltaproteobacteria bacterium]|nr:hypothetical protein [Deltaproteobacteria bacterium]